MNAIQEGKHPLTFRRIRLRSVIPLLARYRLSKITSLNISLLAQEWSIVRGPPAAPQPLFPLLTSTKRAGVIARNWQRLYRGCQLTNSPNKLTGQPSAPDSGSEDGSKPSSALPRIEAKEPRAKKQRMFGIDQFEPWQSRLNE
jgi:hypothetical protein